MKGRKKGNVLIAVGMLLLVAAFAAAVYNIADERTAETESRKILSLVEDEIPEGVTRKDNEVLGNLNEWDIPSYVLDPDREMPEIEMDGHKYIGVLSVPSIELELPIMSTWDDKKLKIAPCRYVGSAYQNNLVIAGHNYRSHFSPLKKLVGGEEIIFTDAEGNRFVYEVAEAETMKGTEIERMVTGEWDLTLFTCTYNGRSRFALRCDLVDSYAHPAPK